MISVKQYLKHQRVGNQRCNGGEECGHSEKSPSPDKLLLDEHSEQKRKADHNRNLYNQVEERIEQSLVEYRILEKFNVVLQSHERIGSSGELHKA